VDKIGLVEHAGIQQKRMQAGLFYSTRWCIEVNVECDSKVGYE
jgi:hypothetical protein